MTEHTKEPQILQNVTLTPLEMQEEIAALHHEKADLIEIGQGLYKQITQLRQDKAELVALINRAVNEEDEMNLESILGEMEAAIAKHGKGA